MARHRACAVFFALAAALLSAAAAGEVRAGGGEVVVTGGRTQAIFSTTTGALLALTDLRSGRRLAGGGDGMLFQFILSASGSGQPLIVSNLQASSVRVRSRGGVVRMDFRRLGGRAISATALVSCSDAGLRLRLSATIPPHLHLERVQFPRLALQMPLGDNPADDAIVMGRTKGGVFRHPAAWRPNTWLAARQPGSLAAQFACYYDPTGGLYLACEDSSGWPKGIVFHRGRSGLETYCEQYLFARGRWELPYDIVLAGFGDAGRTTWRHAADIYKSWAARQPWCARRYYERDDVPSWLKSGPAMVRFGRQWLRHPQAIKESLRRYWEKHFYDRGPLIVALWGWEKLGAWITPDYFPTYPSDAAFSQLARWLRQHGGHVFVWPSGYHYTLTFGKRRDGTFQWDDGDRFCRQFATHAVWTRAGEPYHAPRPWLRGGETACMCPGDPWTIDWLNRIAVELCKRGAELIQIDQVVGGAFQWCYAPHHPHPPGPGQWMTDVFRRQLRTMLAACRAVQPAAVVGFEEPNEHFIQEVAIQDYRDTEVLGQYPPARPASIFGYLYHEYLPCFQSNPRPGDAFRFAYCLVNGQIPHFIPPRRLGPGPLLAGGGFESWVDHVPEGWEKVSGWKGQVYDGRCAPDAARVREGRWSLRLECDRPGQIVQVAQNVRVAGAIPSGARCRLALWAASEAVGGKASVALAALAGGPGVKVLRGASAEIYPGGAWRRVTVDLALPHGTALVRIMLHLVGPGRVWIDDARFFRVFSDGRVVELQQPPTPAEHALIRRWVELFHGCGRDFLLLGAMEHPPRLECATAEVAGMQMPAVLHNAYRAPDGRRAVVLANWTGRRQPLRLWLDGAAVDMTLTPLGVKLVEAPAGGRK